MSGPKWRRQLIEHPQAPGHHLRAGIEEGPIPVPELGALGGLLANRPQEAISLLERTRIRGQGRTVGREATRGDPVQRPAAKGRGAGDQEHLLGREDHDAEGRRQGCGAARHAVDPDSLSPTAGRGVAPRPHQRDFEGGLANRPLHAGDLGAPPDEVHIGRGPVRVPPGKEHDRLEEARLAGRVRTPEDLGSRSEPDVERSVAAKVGEPDGREPWPALTRWCGPA